MTADAFTRANPLYTSAKAKGSTPIPLAAGEIAEHGRAPNVGHTIRLLAVFCFGTAAILSVCVFAMAVMS